MKTIEALAIVASLGLISGSSAFAQDSPGGKPKKQPDFTEIALKHLTEGYASIAAFDKNKDGALNDSEKEAIADALKDGSLHLPPPPMPPPPPKDGSSADGGPPPEMMPPMPPPPPKDGSAADGGPPPEMMPPIGEILPAISSLYEAVAALDADKNGSLDVNEMVVLKKAFEDGKLPLPPVPPHRDGPPMGEPPPGSGCPRP